MKNKYVGLKFLVKRSIFIILISSFLIHCKKDNVNPDEKIRTYLTDFQLIAKVSASQISTLAYVYPEVYNMLLTKDLLNVEAYKIEYKTVDVAGQEIIASGAVIVPVTDKAIPVLSYQHGSLFSLSDAPSLYFTGMETRGLATIIASTGYAVSVPDYLGYGVSSDYNHPYEHAKTLASASYHMLMAAKELFVELGINTNEKLFLTGYSEGGNATMALHKHIEENSNLVVTMSAPASGAYNKTAFAKDILQRNEELDFLPRFMWVIDSYNWIYNLNRPWNQFVNDPYATALEAINNPMNLADATISHNPQELFTTSVIDGVINETDTPFLNALSDNDDYNWTPKYPITLFYGTADDYVFPLNSISAFDALTANGAAVDQVVYPGLDHSTAFLPYVLDMIDLFESLK